MLREAVVACARVTKADDVMLARLAKATGTHFMAGQSRASHRG